MVKNEKWMFFGFSLILVLIGVIAILSTDILPFSIQLEQDSIFLDVADRSYTDISVMGELYPYDDIHIIVNSIGSSSVTTTGSAPQSICSGIWRYNNVAYEGCCTGTAQAEWCCVASGYSRYVSDTGWNVCVTDTSIEPEYIIISVGGTEVYLWDGIGDYPAESDNFAEIVNSACGLDQPLVICEDSKYLYSSEYNTCVYYQLIEDLGEDCRDIGAENLGHYGNDYVICSQSAVERQETEDCQIRVNVESGNGYGYLNLGLSVGNTQPVGEIVLVQPPVLDSTGNDDNGNGEQDVVDESASWEGFNQYIQENTLFVSLVVLFAILILGGLMYGWQKRR